MIFLAKKERKPSRTKFNILPLNAKIHFFKCTRIAQPPRRFPSTTPRGRQKQIPLAQYYSHISPLGAQQINLADAVQHLAASQTISQSQRAQIPILTLITPTAASACCTSQSTSPSGQLINQSARAPGENKRGARGIISPRESRFPNRKERDRSKGPIIGASRPAALGYIQAALPAGALIAREEQPRRFCTRQYKCALHLRLLSRACGFEG